MEKIKSIAGKVLYVTIGLISGAILTIYYVTPRFAVLEKDSIMGAKVSFLRGCTMANTLDTCKKHPGYTDHEEIYEKIEKEVHKVMQLKIPENPAALQLSNDDQKEVQKIIQGRQGIQLTM